MLIKSISLHEAINQHRLKAAMEREKLFKSCLNLFVLLSVLNTVAQAQDNESIIATTTLSARTIEIVFLHEPDQIEFSSAVDAIMEQLKLTDIEINYRKILYDRQTMPEMPSQVCELAENGLSLLIDGTLSGCDAVRDILKAKQIPYFNFDFSIQSLVKIMDFYLVERQAFDVVLILQDKVVGLEAFHNFVGVSSMRVMILDPAILDRLWTFHPAPDYYVIIADTVNATRIFQDARDAGLVHRSPNSWNVMFTDNEGERFNHLEYPEVSRLLLHKNVCCNPECICSSHATLKFEALSSFLHQMLPVLEANDFPIRRFDCNKVADVSLSADGAEQLLNDLSSMIEANGLIYVDDDLKIWQNVGFDVKQSLNNSSSLETVAVVDRNGVKLMANQLIGRSKRFYRIGVSEAMPYTYFKRDPKTNEVILDGMKKPIYEGYCIDLIREFARRLNFSYELVGPSSGKFGERQSDGRFDGLVGDMARGEIDVIVGALKMTAEREEVIDFVSPYFEQTGILIVMKKPVADTSLFKFMSVLRLEVWLSILGALSITAIVVWILEVLSPYSARNWKYSETCRNFTLRESFWFALTSFTPQGGGEAPKALSGRVIVAAYWLFVVLMLATFTANLAAFLTVERMSSPVQSLDQLSRQSRINYTVVKDTDTHQYFKNMRNAEDKLYELWKNLTLSSSSDDVQYRIWDYPVKEQYASILMSIEGTKLLPNASEGFRIVNEQETNDFAFIHDANEIKYEISRNCNYSAVGDVFAEQSYAVAVQQGSHLQDEFSRMILELQKERFFEDLTARYWNSSFTASCINNDDSEGITLESLGGVFIATLVGLVVAMLVLVGEVYYYKKKTKKEKERRQLAIFSTTKIQPFDVHEFSGKVIKNSVLLGSGNFIPVNKKHRLSFVSVQPRD